MLTVPAPIKPLALKTTDVNLWVNGVNTEVDALRLGVQALSTAINLLLSQDGILRPRPSLRLFGPQPTGTMLGKPGKFTTNEGLTTTNWLISMQVVSDVAKVYIAKPEDTEWTICIGGTFDNAAHCTFTQIAQKMLVFNGVDSLAFLDLTTVNSSPAVTQMEALSDPTTAATLTGTGFTGTNLFDVSYSYTYNSTVGETLPSPLKTISLPTDRSGWNASTQNVKVTIPSPGETIASWNLYVSSVGSGDTAQEQFMIAQGLSPSNLNFIDDGTAPLITNITPPLGNSTDGPHAKGAIEIGGLLFVYQDSANAYGISIGSQIPGFELDFSPSHGGQVLQISPGSGNLPMVVWNFRSGPGDPQVKCMTKDNGGAGKRYTLAQNTLTFNGQQITVWGYEEDYGYNGTTAAKSLIAYNNSTYYLAFDGFYTTGTKPQLQNLLDTDNISNTLSSDDFLSLNQAAIDKTDSSVWQNRLYWCVPVGSDHNNQIWTLDLVHGGAWMKPWNIQCDGITVITDNSGINHQIFLVNNQLLESTYQVMTADNGVPFPTLASTAAIGFSADMRTWAQVLKLVIVLLRARGAINFQVEGWTQNGQIEQVGSGQFNSDASGVGYGWNETGYNTGNLLGWNQFNPPALVAKETIDIDIDINQRLRFLIVNVQSIAANTDYGVSNIIPLFTVVGVQNLE